MKPSDDNGNILTYLRHGNTAVGPLAMDSLNYNYNKATNQLNYVLDAVPAANYPNDINNETPNNYQYNAIGQLAKDDSAQIDTIIWNVYGKVQEILFNKVNDSVVNINYVYDPLGNRIEKIWSKNKYCAPPCTFYNSTKPITDTTRYSRDAQGNILAVYNRKNDSVWLKEWDIYGSKRVGVVDTTMLVGTNFVNCTCTPLSNPIDSSTIGYLEGQKQYELTNHLGNVLVTVSDKKTAIDTTATPYIANFYEPVIINAQDYYPFGMVMPGRSYSLAKDSSYAFLFNGKLHDDDIYGKDNSYDYGARIYDPRVGRFLSIDPIESQYPMLSPYQFASLNPIRYVDLDGKEAATYVWQSTGFSPNTPPSEAWDALKSGLQEVGKEVGQAAAVAGIILLPLAPEDALFGEAAEGSSLAKTYESASEYAKWEAEAGRAAAKTEDASTVQPEAESASSKSANQKTTDGEVKQAAKEQKTSSEKKLSKVEKSKKTEEIGGGKYTKTTEVKPGKGPGQSRAEYTRYKNKEGRVIKNVKDSYDRSGKFQHRKLKELPDKK